jgi:methylene-tetrahydromethanopterin dehydrogenase
VATRLKVAADVIAVPPEGIAGVGVMDDAKPIAGTGSAGVGAVGIGALAVGNVKYQTQHRLLVQMQQAEKAVSLSFAEAFTAARAFLAEKAAEPH